jgi:hypothetical protein
LELVGLVVLYFIGSFLVTGFFFVTSSSRRGERLAQTWGAYAARRRYHFSPGTTPERPLRIAGSRGALDFVLEVHARDAVFTRLVARAPWSGVGRVVAVQGRGRRGEKSWKMTTGDAHFDRLFDVRATDERAVRRVLRPDVRMALQRFPMRMIGAGLRLAVDGNEVVVEWAGGEVQDAEIDAAHAILGKVCSPAAGPSS